MRLVRTLRATIKDVAKKSGVSIATVSKYLNGGNVREHNRVNIERAIEELDYRVNSNARGLKTKKSMTIGIVVDNITNIFYTSVISYVEDRLLNNGYSSIICNTKENEDIFKKKMNFLISKGVDGIILFTTSISQDLLRHYVDKGVRMVVVDTIINNVDCDFITIDNISGAYNAIEQFILKGHRRIAIITGEDRNFSAMERLKGYLRALEDYNIPLDDNLIYKNTYDIEGGYRAFKKMLRENRKNLPTAVLISNYFMTVGSMIAINEENINIPNDLSVICFDNFELSKVFKPKLTFVSQPIDEIGYKAAQLLLDKLNNKDTQSMILRIPPQLVLNPSIKKID
jgi:LacI family transcriptional regulator